MTRIIASLLFGALVLAAPLASSAAPITVPTDLNVGDTYRLAFVTSTTRDATSSDIADYNAFVTAAANSVPELLALATTWKAIGSTPSIDARDNTGTNPNVSTGVPIYRLNDIRIANDNADLWDGTVASPPFNDENGDYLYSIVHTGTTQLGVADPNFSLGEPTAVRFGNNGQTTSLWIEASPGTTTSPRSLYAMSGVLTVVPEPSTLALAAFGFLALATFGWRQRTRSNPPFFRGERQGGRPLCGRAIGMTATGGGFLFKDFGGARTAKR